MSESFVHHQECEIRTGLFENKVLLSGAMVSPRDDRFFSVQLTRSEAVRVAHMLMKTAVMREEE